jgi:TPR repeat protein
LREQLISGEYEAGGRDDARPRAVEYYRLSAEQGNSYGQYAFGQCLENGIGVEKDLKRAAEYYRLSAEQNNSQGQYNFGYCLEHGLGIAQDLVRASEYYRLSAERPRGEFNE